MSKQSAIIEKLTLNIAGQKIELSPDQAQRLYNELHALFGSRGYGYYPYYPYTTPYTAPYTPYTSPLTVSNGAATHRTITVN